MRIPVVSGWIGLTLLSGTLALHAQTITVRSGNGAVGGTDGSVHFLLGPATGNFGHVFTASDFSAAQTGHAAYIVTTNPLWVSSLPADESAKWIGSNADAGLGNGNTALYAVSFQITSAFTSATMELFYAADDAIGDGTNTGIYLNGSAVCGGPFAIGFSQQNSVSCGGIVSSLLHVGTNWLYIEDGNVEGSAGLLFSATIITTDLSGAGLLVNVPGTAMPWLYSTASGGLNSQYQFGLNDGSNPVIVSSANGINFAASNTLTVTYLNGAVSVGPEIALAYTDANGFPGDTTTSTGTFAPGHYMNPPGYISELVGTFTNSNGAIIGTPFALGDGPTVLTIPVGATQLQLGVDDDRYGDNVGSWVIQVTPATTALPSINTGGVVDSADFAAPVSPGSIASVFGTFPVSSSASATVTPLPTTLSGLSMQFSGIPVPLLYASPGQSNVQIPWELTGQNQTLAIATVGNQTSPQQTVQLAALAPGIFTMNAQGQGAILNTSNQLVNSSNPAVAGTTYIQIFCTGLGPVTNQPASGAAAPANPLATTTTLPTLTIGGVPATTVLFSGLAPTAVGLYQVNAQVPAGAPPGNAVPVVIKIGGATSNTVTIAVQAVQPPNPQPTINSLSPSFAAAGSPSVTLTINGTGFIATSSVTFNGIAHSATFVNSSQLTITLNASDLSASGTFLVVVTNPPPGGGSSSPAAFTANAPLAPNFTGNWSFVAKSALYGIQSSASGQLTQTGDTVTGQLNVSGTPCATSAAVNGTISGTTLSITLNENGQLVTFTGTVSADGSQASGTYAAPLGGCTNGDYGTWSGERIPISSIKFIQSAIFTYAMPPPLSTYTATFSSSVTAGDLIILAFWWNYPLGSKIVSVTDSHGNSYNQALVTPTGNDDNAWIYYAANASTGPLLSITVVVSQATADQFSMVALEYSGVHSLDAISTNLGSLTSSNTTSNSGGALTHEANELVIGVSLSNEENGTTAGGGFTTRFASNYFMVEDKIVSSVGTYNAEFVLPTGCQFCIWTAGIATFY